MKINYYKKYKMIVFYIYVVNYNSLQAYCGKDVDLKPKENIVRCKECAYRILFKKRTRNLM